MVSFKNILLAAAAIVAVAAQDPPAPQGTLADAEAYWGSAGDEAVDGDSPEKRGLVSPRNQPIFKDPYKGLHCRAPYTEPPCETKCNRNNCFRAFLNARDGSEGKHCPKEAFAFCCKWNHANPWFKYKAVEFGWVYKLAPYTKNCKNNHDKCWDVVNKLNDVCGCTLNHEVQVDIVDQPDYWGLRHYNCGNKKCH